MKYHPPLTEENTFARCQGKVSFDAAKLAFAVSKRSRKGGEEPLGPYKCNRCGNWHIGTNNPYNKKYGKRPRIEVEEEEYIG